MGHILGNIIVYIFKLMLTLLVKKLLQIGCSLDEWMFFSPILSCKSLTLNLFAQVSHQWVTHNLSISLLKIHQLICWVTIWAKHSVESPSIVDPQWDIWYWGSKWNLHTDCLSAVGCEWGTTSVYFGITYVCFIPSRLAVFADKPQFLLQDFVLSIVSFEGHTQKLQEFHVGLKFEWSL